MNDDQLTKLNLSSENTTNFVNPIGSLTLQQWQNKIQQLVVNRGWQKDNIHELYFLFQEEIGEVTKAIRVKEKYHLEHKPNEPVDNLPEELADVFFYLLDIANFYQINLTRACEAKLKANKQRQWSL